jgi:hypothetical protein
MGAVSLSSLESTLTVITEAAHREKKELFTAIEVLNLNQLDHRLSRERDVLKKGKEREQCTGGVWETLTYNSGLQQFVVVLDSTPDWCMAIGCKFLF